MKKIFLAILIFSLQSQISLAGPSQGKPAGGPHPGYGKPMPGPGGGAFKELAFLKEVVSAHEQTISQITSIIVAAFPAKTYEKQQKVQNLRTALQNCFMYDEQYKAQCVRDNSVALVQAALATEAVIGSCRGKLSSNGYVWDGYGGTSCSEYFISGVQFVLKKTSQVNFTSIAGSSSVGYEVEITSGACAGKSGYIFAGFAALDSCGVSY